MARAFGVGYEHMSFHVIRSILFHEAPSGSCKDIIQERHIESYVKNNTELKKARIRTRRIHIHVSTGWNSPQMKQW